MVTRRPDELLPCPLFSGSITLPHGSPELIHNDALEAARVEHERVRRAAIRAFENNELQLSQLRLRQEAAQETERLRLERERAELAARVIELQKTHIPVPEPPPRLPTPPRAKTPPRKPSPPPQIKPPAAAENAPPDQKDDQRRNEALPPGTIQAQNAQTSQPFGSTSNGNPPASTTPFGNSNTRQNEQNKPSMERQQAESDKPPVPSPAPPAPTTNADSHLLPGATRYVEIHQQLKRLRTYMKEQAGQNPALKKKMNEGRRIIRMSIGQLTEGKGANKQQVRTRCPCFVALI